jgi:general secretion pathway protein N
MKRVVTGTLLVLLLGLVLLAAFFPVSWAWGLVQDRVTGVHLGRLHGSVWNGRAEGVVYEGLPLGTVQWTLSRAALVGKADLHVEIHGALARGSAHLLRQGDVLTGENMHVTVNAGEVPVSVGASGLQPRGQLLFDIERVELRGDWPRQLRGEVVWRHAALAGRDGSVPLGELHAHLHERAGSILEARLSDAGGPLALSGTAQASTLGWRVDATLRPRNADPELRHALRQLGTLDADGTLQLRRQGGLMMGEQP